MKQKRKPTAYYIFMKETIKKVKAAIMQHSSVIVLFCRHTSNGLIILVGLFRVKLS